MILCALVFALLVAAAHGQMPTATNVRYGTHERQVVDFWKADAASPTACLFFVHGGGWMNGDKANPDFLANCVGAGISVVSINYRFIPDAIAEGVNPPVKACLEDAARALQFVRSKAGEWNIDKARIAGCGGSAGGFTSLWLAFHPDMADATSADPIARESTRLRCVLTFVPQTTLDPALMREWIPNNDYGHHAFALPGYQDFLEQREKLLPWIAEFSPLSLVSPDDPPTYLFYDSAPALGQPAKDPPHSANFGVKLAETLEAAGVECEFNYTGATSVKHPDIFGFLAEKLK
ncbi:MAG: alpha/beta hydrolase [Chthoniobacteraceae bacterium]